jgi:hypothetical protein
MSLQRTRAKDRSNPQLAGFKSKEKNMGSKPVGQSNPKKLIPHFAAEISDYSNPTPRRKSVWAVIYEKTIRSLFTETENLVTGLSPNILKK